MRIPRFTTRRLMLLVLVEGVSLGVGVQTHRLWQRAAECRARADEAKRACSSCLSCAIGAARVRDRVEVVRSRTLAAYYDSVYRRYDRVARYPWESLSPEVAPAYPVVE